MPALKIELPFPIFTDVDGDPLEDGYVYIGQSGLNPEVSPIQVYWDSALSAPAAQPIRTVGGYASRSGSPGKLYVNAVNFSILVKNKNGTLIWSELDGSGISPNADGVVYNEGDAGAVDRTVGTKLREFKSVEDFGAVGDGVNDDTAELTAALATGITRLQNGKTYLVSSRLLVTGDSQGFICDGQATILMDRGGFTAATYAGLAANSVGFEAQGFDRLTLKGVKFQLTAGAGVRTCCAVAIRNCTNIDVDVEVTGFQEMEFGAVTIDSCIGGDCKVNVHDITTDNNTLPTMQLTGLKVDENRVGGVYSKDIHFITPKFKNITLGAAALAAYGYQTDGMTLAGGSTSGTGGCVVDVVTVENVYEGLDIQSSNHVIAGIKARDIAISPLKLVHAGKNNVIGDLDVVNTGGPVVVFVGTSTATESADNNVVGNITAIGVNDIAGTGQPTCAVHFAGTAAVLKPNNNIVKGITVTSSANMTVLVLDEAGLRNRVLDANGVGTLGVCTVDATQLANDHVFLTKLPRSAVRAGLTADQLAVASGTRIAFNTFRYDTQLELNTANGQYVSKGPMLGRASAGVRIASLTTGNYVEARLVANGLTIGVSRLRNDSGAGQEINLGVSGVFKLTNRSQVVEAVVYTSAATVDISSTYTNMAIEEIG